jgi:hypothetical protein
MTDNAASELFTQDGSAGSVKVNQGDLVDPPAPAKIVFVPLSEARQANRLTPPGVLASGQRQASESDKVIRPLYQGVFSGRIAKVKQETADIFRQLRELKFTDEQEASEPL